MNAREMFKGIKPEGKVLLCSKGGYDYGRDAFAYRICDDGKQYHITVLSEVNPRQYSVPYGPQTTVETLETAIHYNEWVARRMAVMAAKENEGSLAATLSGATARSQETEGAGREPVVHEFDKE